MRIAIVVERFPPDIGGSGVRFFNIAQRLAYDHTIDVITLNSGQTPNSRYAFRTFGFSPKMLSFFRLGRAGRVASLAASSFLELLLNRYDIVDVDIWPMLPFFSARIAKLRTPVVISWNVVWPFSCNKNVSKACTLLANLASRLSTHSITVSWLAKTMLVEQVNVDTGKIDVIPNGVDEAFSKTRLEPQQGRIVFVGRLEPQKRLDLLIRAFKIAKTKIREAEFHIIGAGPLRPQIMNASRRTSGLYLHEPVTAADKSELASQLSRSWVFVSASEFETYGLSIAESLSMGLPVILTRTPYNAAIGELVKHEHNGLIVEHDQPDAIAKALERLYEDPRLWETLSYNAKHSTPFHSWDEVAEKTESVYEKTINRR
jgi:glycosyltransferase involved in cell wall biosynthesis